MMKLYIDDGVALKTVQLWALCLQTLLCKRIGKLTDEVRLVSSFDLVARQVR